MREWFRGGGRDWLMILAAAMLFLIALLGPFAMALAQTPEETQLQQAYESGQLIRLHVVAHSDSAYDQQVKLAVRDAVIDAFQQEVIQAANAGCDELFAWLLQSTDRMEQTALQCARSLGFCGDVRAECGVLALPAKTYGSVTLPAGEYRALRITLGSGQGRNWWCVLYPQLCLALAQEEPEKAVEWDAQRILRKWLLFSP